jgi:sodium-dependent dicarboxylate transporter 2/3/5
MEKIQILIFFVSGFLLSRLLIKVRAPQWLVFQLIGKRHLRPSRIILYLVGSAALLSIFIPNVLTVLTLLPVIALLRAPLEQAAPARGRQVATFLALSLIYGSNIGGIGSVTATPANGILITYTLVDPIPGTEVFAFDRWLLWAFPLVIVLTLTAWGVLVLAYRPNSWIKDGHVLTFSEDATHHAHQHAAALVTLIYFFTAIVFSVWMQHTDAKTMVLWVSAGFTVLFIASLFLVKVGTGVSGDRAVLLQIKDCYSDLPMRGILFVVIFVALTGILWLLGVQKVLAEALASAFSADTPLWKIFFGFALMTSFSTELLSNTVVQIAMFTVVPPLVAGMNVAAAPVLLVITLSCTAAFMSPAATGVNGLAFGEIRGMSLLQMLAIGVVMNVVGALILSTWVRYVVF